MSSSRLADKLNRRHPLQRLDSPSKGLSGVVHLLGLYSFYTSFKYLSDNPNKISYSWAGHYQYLTIIGLSLATISFLSALIADSTSSRTAFLLKNYVSLVATPIAVLVSVLYWSLRAIDTSLVIPPDLPRLPPFEDLGFHLFPATLLTFDTLFLSPPWPTTPMNPSAPLISLITSTALAFLYWFWIEICYSHNGFYPYPIFALLNTTQRIGLFALSGFLMWAVGAALRAMYAWLNGMEIVGAERAEKKER